MDINFTNKTFLNYLTGISFKTRRQVFGNISSKTRVRQAVAQIGTNVSVNLTRLTPEELKKYARSDNSHGIKSKPRPKNIQTGNTIQEVSTTPLENHSTSEDTQLSSKCNASLDNLLDNSLEPSNKDVKEENNLSSTQNKVVSVLSSKDDSRNQNLSSADSNSSQHTSSLSDKVKKSRSCPALNKTNESSNIANSSTKELDSTNKTYQNKSDNNKKEEKKMEQRTESEKYKLTIIDLFGEDDCSREINIPEHKKVDSSSKSNGNKHIISPKKIFADKSTAGNISKMRRKSICEERTLQRCQSSEEIIARRKTVCQENASNDDNILRRRNRSKSKDNEAVTAKNKYIRPNLFQENESSKDDTSKRRNRSKSRDKEPISANKETKIDRRKREPNEETARTGCSKTLDKETIKTTSKIVGRRKTVCQENVSNEDDSMRRTNRSKSKDREVVTATNKHVRSLFQENESNKDDTSKRRNRSKSRDKEFVVSTNKETKQVLRKEPEDSARAGCSKTLDKETVKTTGKIISRRKTVCDENLAGVRGRTNRSKSRDKEYNASKSNETKPVRRKGRILYSDSEDDDTVKKRGRPKSQNKEAIASNINETKKNQSKRVSQENDSTEHDAVKKTNRSCDEETKIMRRKNIYQDKEPTKGNTTKERTSSTCREDKTQKKNDNKEVKRSQSQDEEQILKQTTENTKGDISNKCSASQEKSNFFSALHLNHSSKKNSSSSAVLAQDESSNTNCKSSRNKENASSTGDSKSTSKGRNTPSVSRDFSKDKNSSSTPKATKDSTIVATPNRRKETNRDNSADSSNKKTVNKDKIIVSPNSNIIKKQHKSPKDELKQGSPNTPQKRKSVCDPIETVAHDVSKQQKSPKKETNESFNTPKRSKSICERRETLDISSDSSLDDVNLNARRKLASKEDDSSDTSSDVTLLKLRDKLLSQELKSPSKISTIKIEKTSPLTPKTITPVEQDTIEQELESIFNASSKAQKQEEEVTPSKRTRSLSRCSFFVPKEAKDTAGSRKRALSTCETNVEEDSSKRRKSQCEEVSASAKLISYINYADLLQQMSTSLPAKKPIDFVDPLVTNKTGFSKPHYTHDEDNNTDVTYDSVIVIQDKDNSPHKLLVRKKSRQEVEEFQKRIVSRRHSFHFEDITPKVEPDDSNDDIITIDQLKESPKSKITRRKSVHQMNECPKPIKSILKRRSSESLTTNGEGVDLNDNTVPEHLPSSIPVTIDLQSIDIDKMFPSTSNDDVITLEISSDDGSTEDFGTSRLSIDSAIDDVEKEIDNKIKADMLKNKLADTASSSQESSDSDVNNKDLQSLTTEQAVDISKDLFVSLLYIYDQYYKMVEHVESQKQSGLTPDMTFKNNFFITRRNKDLTKMYKKLITVKVNHFSLILFFDRLMKTLKDKFEPYKEISEVVILFFMQRIIWIILDYFISPSEENSLFNHITACESVEYLTAKHDEIMKYATDLDKKVNDCFHDFSKKIYSETKTASSDVLKTAEDPKPIIVTLKKQPERKPSKSVPSKKSLSLPVIDSSEPSTSKPNPPPKRRGRPPKKIVYPEIIPIVPKPKLPTRIPKTKNVEKGIFANINKTKSYLSTGTQSEPSERIVENPQKVAETPQVRRKSPTSYEVTFNNNSAVATVQKSFNNFEQPQPVPAPNIQQPKQQAVEPNKAIKILDVVVSHNNNPSVNQQYIINNQTEENVSLSDPPANSQLTSEKLQMLKRGNHEMGQPQQRMITVDGTIVDQKESSSANIVSSTIVGHIEKPSALPPIPPLRRDSSPSQNIPISQVQPNIKRPRMTNISSSQNTISSPQEVPMIQGAPLPVPFPVALSTQHNPINLVQNQGKANPIQGLPVSQSYLQSNIQSQSISTGQAMSQNRSQVPQHLPQGHNAVSGQNKPLVAVLINQVNTSFTQNLNQGPGQNRSPVGPLGPHNQNLTQNISSNQASSQNNAVVPVRQGNVFVGPTCNRPIVHNGPPALQTNMAVPVNHVPPNTPSLPPRSQTRYQQSSSVHQPILTAASIQSSSQVYQNRSCQSIPHVSYATQQPMMAYYSPHQMQYNAGMPNRASSTVHHFAPNQELVSYPHNLAYAYENIRRQALARQNYERIMSEQMHRTLPTYQEYLHQNHSGQDFGTGLPTTDIPAGGRPQQLGGDSQPFAPQRLPVQNPKNQSAGNLIIQSHSRQLQSAGNLVVQQNHQGQPMLQAQKHQVQEVPAQNQQIQQVVPTQNRQIQPMVGSQNHQVQQVVRVQNHQVVPAQNRQLQQMVQVQNHQIQPTVQTQNRLIQQGVPAQNQGVPAQNHGMQAEGSPQLYHRLISNGNSIQFQQVENQMVMSQSHPTVKPTTSGTNHVNPVNNDNQSHSSFMVAQKQNQQSSNQLASLLTQTIVPRPPTNQIPVRNLVEPQKPLQQQSPQPIPARPEHRLTSRSLEELEAMADNTIQYLIDSNTTHKQPTKTLIRPSLIEIERLQRELEEINRSCPSTYLTTDLPHASYDMNSATVAESSVVSTSTTVQSSDAAAASKDAMQHTIKWRMKKSASQNEQPMDVSSTEQNRQDGSVIRYQPEGHNKLRNISRDSGYLSPCDVTSQNPEQGVICERCMGPSRLMCSGCHTYYCSVECQQLSWPEHEKKCYTINGFPE